MRPLRALFLESTKNALKMCPLRALSLEFTKSALKMHPLRELFLESTINALKMCPLRALSLKFTKRAHKFSPFQHHIPCPQKMLDARLLNQTFSRPTQLKNDNFVPQITQFDCNE